MGNRRLDSLERLIVPVSLDSPFRLFIVKAGEKRPVIDQHPGVLTLFIVPARKKPYRSSSTVDLSGSSSKSTPIDIPGRGVEPSDDELPEAIADLEKKLGGIEHEE